MALAKLCDRVFGEFDEEKENKKPLWQVLIELFFYLWFIGVVVYVVQLIPFPFHGVYGYDHFRVKELINAVIFFVTFLHFQNYYQKKITYLFTRL